MDDKKDFFHIGKMTESFRKASENPENFKGIEQYQVWDLRFKVAIAQQLSVISGRLGEIVSKSKEEDEK